MSGRTSVNTLVIPKYRIRLLNRFMEPMPGAPFRITIAGQTRTGKADKDGWIETAAWGAVEQCHLEWSHPEETAPESGPERPARVADAPSDDEIAEAYEHIQTGPAEIPEYSYEADLHLQLDGLDAHADAARRLHNLGYACGSQLDSSVLAYQRAHGLNESGACSEIIDDLSDGHDSCEPKVWPCPRYERWLA
jgi:hypothetical protein